MLSIVLSVIFSVYAARQLGVDSFGRFSFILSLVTYFLVFSGAELQNLLVRDVAKDKERSLEILTSAITFKLIISVFSIILIVLLGKLIGKDYLLLPLAIYALSLIPASFYDAFDAVFRAWEKMEYIAIASLAYAILRTGMGVFLIYQGRGLNEIFIALLAAEAFKALVIYLFHQYRIKSFEWKFNPRTLSYLFRESRILILIKGGLGLVYYRADIIILSALIGDWAVGQFSVSVNLCGLFSMASVVVLGAILPVASRWYKEDIQKMHRLLRLTFIFTVIGFTPVIIGFTVFSQQIIGLFYGKEYLVSAEVLPIIIWSAFFSTLLGIQGILLLVTNKYKKMAKVYSLVVILKLALSYYLIQHHGLRGAAIGYALSDGLALLVYQYYVHRK